MPDLVDDLCFIQISFLFKYDPYFVDSENPRHGEVYCHHVVLDERIKSAV